MSRTKTLWVRQPYLEQILAGKKTVEVRVGYDNVRRLQAGDRLRLNDEHMVRIQRVAHYADFEGLLAAEDAAAIAPDLPPEQLLSALRELYPPEKEALGAVALELAIRRYEAVLFDLGYTLIHFEPPQETIVQRALAAIGVERSIDQIRAAVERAWGAFYHDAETATFPPTVEHDAETQDRLSGALLAALGLEAEDEALRTYRETLETWFSQPGVLRPYPETVEVLETLRAAGYRLGIISNWSWNLQERVEAVGLADYFEMVWASAYAGCNKPHPCIFEQALAQMGLAPGQALYVGDSYRHDVLGARGVGMEAVLVERDGRGEARDCVVIGDLRGVLELLE